MNLELNAGLLGWPVGHSKSPLIHRLFMEEAGIAGCYSLYPVRPEALPGKVRELMDGGFSGLNLTVPHKEAALDLCSEVSGEAARTGAVNTILFRAGSCIGFNTDVQGFRILSEDLPAPFFVLGRGGAAKAVLAALGPENCVLLPRGGVIPGTETRKTGTVVNATPLGWEDGDGFPLEIPPGWCFADLNYNPSWNWRNGLAGRGVRVVTGERMLVEQAACAFFVWTGYTPGDEIRERALEMVKAESNG